MPHAGLRRDDDKRVAVFEIGVGWIERSEIHLISVLREIGGFGYTRSTLF